MTLGPLLLVTTLYGAVFQDTSRVEMLASLAGSGEQASLVEQVGRYPDAARQALHDLLRESMNATGSRSPPAGSTRSAEALEAAGRIAQAYFVAWTDAFLLQEVRRFSEWPPADRRLKLTADSLRLAGNQAYGSDGIPAAVALWRRSLAYSERLVDEAGAAKSLGNIGAGFLATGETDSARVYLSAAYGRAAAVNDLRTAASAVTNVANLDFENGDLPAAAERYAQAADILGRTGDYRFLSATQHNLGLVSLAMGNLGGARVALSESIRLSRLHGYAEDEAEGLSSLADLERAEGNYGAAAELLERALTLSHDSGNQVAAAGTLQSMGLLAMARGDYAKAMNLLGQSVALYTSLGHLVAAIDVREDLARARVAAGDLQGGLTELRTATRLADSVELGVLRTADLTLTAADLNLALNRYPGARELYRQAQQLYQSAYDRAGEAAAIESDGYLALVRGDGDEAIELLQRAVSMRAGSRDERALAVTRLYLASAQEEIGEIAAARQTLTQARRSFASAGDVVGEASVLATLGGLEARAGAPQQADALYRSGIALLGALPAPEVTWRLHAGRADILESEGNLQEAAQELRIAITTIERAAGTLALSEQRTAFRADKMGVYLHLAGIELRLGNLAAAFAVSEQVRGQQMAAVMGRGRIAPPARVPPELLAREQDAQQHIASLTRQLRHAGPAQSGLREPSAGAYLSPNDLRAALGQAQSRYAEILTEMREAAPAYITLVDPRLVALGDVAAGLAARQALLEYLVDDSLSMVFVVTRDTSVGFVLDIGSDDLGDLVEFARGTIARRGNSDPGELWRVPLERLYGHLIGPVEEAGLLDGVESLVIVPHRELHYLPFEALMPGGGHEFLVQHRAVSYAISASELIGLANRHTGTRQSASRSASNGGREPTVLALAPRVDQLPGSRYEVEVVGRLFGPRARVLTGRDATESAFLAAAPQYDIVHLATFGVLNKANPLFSYVELAETRGEPGLLEAREVFGLDLRAQLLTLSACETAVGSSSRWDSPAGEDWLGLAAAFLGAGAENVLASLWQVEDRATAELMQRFYRHLASGAPLAQSLAEAQRELIANPDTAHPFYWAGFVLIGAGEALQ